MAKVMRAEKKSKNETCFWCNKKMPRELCRRYGLIENPSADTLFEVVNPEDERYSKLKKGCMVCFSCEGKMRGELQMTEKEKNLWHRKETIQ